MIRRTRVRVPCCLIDDPRPSSLATATTTTTQTTTTTATAAIDLAACTTFYQTKKIARRGSSSASSSPKSRHIGPPSQQLPGNFFCEKEDCAVYVLAEPAIAADALDAAISSRFEVFFNISSICQLLKVFSARRCKFLAKDFLKFVEQHRCDYPSAVQSVAQSVAVVQSRIQSCYSETGLATVRTCDAGEHTVNSALLEKVAVNWQPFSDVRKVTCTDCKLDLFRLTSALHFEQENHQDSINDRLLAMYVARISQNKRFSRVPGFLYWLVDVATPLLKAVVQRELHLALLLHSLPANAAEVAERRFSVSSSLSVSSSDVSSSAVPTTVAENAVRRPKVVGAGIARKKISMNLCDYSLPSQPSSTTTVAPTTASKTTTTAATAVAPPLLATVTTEEEFLLEQTDNANDQDIFSSLSLRSLFETTATAATTDKDNVPASASSSSFLACGNDTQDEWLRFLTHGASSSTVPTATHDIAVDEPHPTTHSNVFAAVGGSCFRTNGLAASAFAIAGTSSQQPLDLSVK